MGTHQGQPAGAPRRGLSRDVLEQLRRTYADGNHVNLRSVIAAAGLSGDDTLLSDLVDADARIRLDRGLEVELSRYADAIPELPSSPAALDTAIEMTLRGMRMAGQLPEQASELLQRKYPQFARAIRTASVLGDLMCSTEGLRRNLASGGRSLPQEFGPMLSDGRRRYELREMLGAGAHGAVYLAADRQLSDRDKPAWVAIKVMGALTTGDEARLADEATKARRVDHPNVARVLDRGVSEDDEPYLAYEYLRGGDLTAYGAAMAGPIPERRAAAMVASLARGLQAAHAAGVAHCDLKPANVLITDGGEPKIADFGVAVRLAGRDPKSAYQRLGSMAFVAPEQYRGEEGALSPLADIYAAGGILFWLLTRRFPNGDSPEEVERRLAGPMPRTEPPDPLQHRAVDADLAAICRRALHPDPKQRYASAEALAADLEAWLRHEPLRWKRTPLRRRVRLAARRQPVGMALSAVVVLLLMGAVGGGVYVQQRRAQMELAHQLGIAHEQSEAQKQRITDAQRMVEATVRAVRTFGGKSDDWMPMLTVLETMLGPMISMDADDSGPDLWSSRIEVVREFLRRASAQGRENELEPMLWETVLGYWLVRTGKIDEAEPILIANRARWTTRTVTDDPWLATIDAMLGCVQARRALASRSPEAMEAAAAVLEDVGPRGASWRNGRAVYRLVLAAQADLYGPEGINDPDMFMSVQRELRRAR